MLHRTDAILLEGFSVTNFKNFGERTKLDLSCPQDRGGEGVSFYNGVVTKATVSGDHGSGKTNLGLALFDISIHLADNRHALDRYVPYLNKDSGRPYAEFEYRFKYEMTRLVYRYAKKDPKTLLYESVTMNGREAVRYDYSLHEGFAELDGNRTDLSGLGEPVSMVGAVAKEVASNNAPETKAFISIVEFAESMLMLDPLCDEGYQGPVVPEGDCIKGIAGMESLWLFKDFLDKHGAGRDRDFFVKETDGGLDLFCRLGDGDVPFRDVATGDELELAAYYYWRDRMDFGISLLYIDDFDSFSRRETTGEIAGLLALNVNVQAVLSLRDDAEAYGIPGEDYRFYEIADGRIVRR